MQLPMRTFWLMCGSINRILAEVDLRNQIMITSTRSREGYENYREQMTVELGAVTKTTAAPDTTRDEAGFRELAAMA